MQPQEARGARHKPARGWQSAHGARRSGSAGGNGPAAHAEKKREVGNGRLAAAATLLQLATGLRRTPKARADLVTAVRRPPPPKNGCIPPPAQAAGQIRAVPNRSVHAEAEFGYSGTMAKRDTLLAQVLHLPLDERAHLVRQVTESLDPGFDSGAEEAWALEIGDRVRALRRGELKTIPAAEVFARAQARLRPPRG